MVGAAEAQIVDAVATTIAEVIANVLADELAPVWELLGELRDLHCASVYTSAPFSRNGTDPDLCCAEGCDTAGTSSWHPPPWPCRTRELIDELSTVLGVKLSAHAETDSKQ